MTSALGKAQAAGSRAELRTGSDRRGISWVEGSMGRFLLLLALSAAAACEPAWSVQGQVRAADGSPSPVAGALLTLRCPGQPDLAARSDRDGLFELGGAGLGPSLSCVVIGTAAGRAVAEIPLRDACEDPSDAAGKCSVAVLEIPLSRR
jgi:hypothetical protein